ncbi:phage tail family protein [Peribacillus frigoritolerans]|uniref:phage tail family protein n=1 Tax=Peribacillus frigoritolerans TaxID=450367 RepID=UPI0030180370
MRYDLKLDFGDGEQNLNDLLPKVRLSSFSPEAPIVDRKSLALPGRNGIILTNQRKTIYKERKIVVKFHINSRIPEQFYLWRHEVYKLLVRDEPYYISNEFEPYKRWLVICDGNFNIDKDSNKNFKEFDVEFTCITGFAESKFMASEFYNLGGEMYGVGMNIPQEDLVYRFNNNYSFKVYNGGDVRLYPTEHDYSVDLVLSGTNVKIKNNNTGEYLTIKGKLTNAKVMILRQYVTVNGKIAKTEGRFPSLVPGYNQIVITGANKSSIDFITRFYFK